MTEPRDDLAAPPEATREDIAAILHYDREVFLHYDRETVNPEGCDLCRQALDRADALLAAYPQLAATDSREEWTVVAAPGARLPNMFDEDMARRWVKVDRKRGVTSTVVRRTVYATPWEDAP